jgi:cytochrome c oxidase assembly factor CtaG
MHRDRLMGSATQLAHLGPDHLGLLTTWLVGVAAVAAVVSAHGLCVRQRRELLTLGAGLAVVAMVLSPPIERVAESSLWGHMAQHLVLTHLAAPLLALAGPAVLLQRHLRRPSARRALGGTVRRMRRLVARPWGAALVAVPFVVAMVTWHVPAAYDAAVRDEVTHGLEHLTMLSTALVVWMVVHDSVHLGPDRFPVGALIVLAAVMAVGGALGAALTFTPSVLYQPPPLASDSWVGLADQRAAAALLWGVGGAVTVLAAVLTVGRWLQRQGESDGGIELAPGAGTLRR